MLLWIGTQIINLQSIWKYYERVRTFLKPSHCKIQRDPGRFIGQHAELIIMSGTSTPQIIATHTQHGYAYSLDQLMVCITHSGRRGG